MKRNLYLVLGLLLVTFSFCWLAIPNYATAQATDTTININVETIEGQSVTDKLITNVSKSWPWYIVRGSGLLAALSLCILMLSGIGQITGSTFKLLDPITAWASHRALGIVFGLSVLAHVVVLLFDHFIKITLPEVLVPWLSDFRPVELFGYNLGSLYLAFGIIAFYLSMGIVVSSLTIISKKPHFWKIIHLLSYIVMLLVFIHALFIGTDLADGWLRYLWIAAGVLILLSALSRLKRAYTS